MSYGCDISFKKVKAENVYTCLQEFKEHCIGKVEDIVKDNFIFSPPFKKHIITENIDPNSWDKDTIEMKDQVETWLSNSILKYRCFYLPKYELLGIYGVDKCVKDFFDNSIYFQNSTDQDYDYDIWNGIDIFEALRDNWKYMSDEDILEFYPDETDFEYFRKTKIYESIWKLVEHTLEDDKSALYLSLIGYWDFQIKERAWHAWCEKVNQFVDLGKEKAKENK
jgi:hypothetical protein